VRWTRPEAWHLTLLFLGSVGPARVPELTTVVDVLASGQASYRARVGPGDGRLRKGGEGVAWLGLVEGAGQLIGLAEAAALACPADATSSSRPKRTPSAHLTVVRKADAAVIEALRDGAYGPIAVEWSVDRIDLVRSYLEPDGARYVTLHGATL